MRIETWRGVTLAIALASALVSGRSARANDPFHHTIPPVVEAIDVNTGGPYYAPPVPYGHYAKDGHLAKTYGLASGLFHGLGGKLHGVGALCHGCGGKGCGQCGGSGLLGGHGGGHGHAGLGDSGCGTAGCGGHGHAGLGGFGSAGCGGHGHAGLGGCGSAGCGGKSFRFRGCGLCGGKGCGVCTTTVMPSTQTLAAAPSGQATTQSGVSYGHGSSNGCGLKGCGLGFGHKHGHNGDPSMGGTGIGGCFHGAGASCGNCSGNGLGMGHGFGHGNGGNGGGNGCQACGGKGCNLCGKALGILGKGKGLVHGLLHPHAGKIEYFVGPGGPVPITPGYVPYVVTTRSPRDFLAFPPFSPDR